MELFIGKRIKELRKKNGMTQERLADILGISFQSVSKWENNIALPDITLVPQLAQIFGVTTDDLFAFSLKEMQADIKRYTDDACALRESNPHEARRILETGLQKYPENDVLMNHMLYVMNYRENPDATIQFAGRLIEKTSRNDIKYDALRFLAYAYNEKGDTKSAVAALEQIPEIICFTKLSETAFVLTGQAKYEAAEKQKWRSFEILIQMMWKIAEYYEAEGDTEKAVTETERALRLIDTLSGDEKIESFSNYADYFKKQIERMKNDVDLR